MSCFLVDMILASSALFLPPRGPCRLWAAWVYWFSFRILIYHRPAAHLEIARLTGKQSWELITLRAAPSNPFPKYLQVTIRCYKVKMFLFAQLYMVIFGAQSCWNQYEGIFIEQSKLHTPRSLCRNPKIDKKIIYGVWSTISRAVMCGLEPLRDTVGRQRCCPMEQNWGLEWKCECQVFTSVLSIARTQIQRLSPGGQRGIWWGRFILWFMGHGDQG